MEQRANEAMPGSNEFNFVFWARRGRRMMKKKVKEPTNEVAL